MLNDEIINIGEWDYKHEQIEVEPVEYDEEGNEVKPAIYEQQVTNPLPEGAVIEDRDFEYNEDRGWFETGTVPPKTELEVLKETVDQLVIDALMGGA